MTLHDYEQEDRLQNDREWRAKLDHLKAEIVARDEKITELHAWADSMLQKIEVLEAQLAALTERHERALIQGADEHRRADSLMETLDASQKEREAKDIALTRIVNECSRFPIKDGLAFRVESIALNGLNSPATPAQETG